MSLTTEQLADFRADIGDDGTVFTDAELQRLYERAGSYNRAIVLALRQLLANASKLHDYSIAHSDQKLSQIFDHLKTLLGYWEGVAASDQAVSPQVMVVGLRPVPPREKDKPRA